MRWLMVALAFGVGPLLIYLMLINPAIGRISDYSNRANLQLATSVPANLGLEPATDREMTQLEEIKQYQLARVKKIRDREALLHFSSMLSDALAAYARSHGLRVLGVDVQNSAIQGRYVPAGNRTMEVLDTLPGMEWDELADPLDLPMMNLPSIEIRMTVSASSPNVFSLIESLPDFPILVSLSGLSIVDNATGRAFQLKIRGYYFAGEQRAQLTGLDTPAGTIAFLKGNGQITRFEPFRPL
jgi:hypothetical protein